MCERRLAVDDLVVYILQDGTFQIGRIPIQDSFGIHRMKPKCHDNREEDLPSDPLYKNILVKLYPNDGHPSDLLPKDLVILDRNLKIGQLVKTKGKANVEGDVDRVGYVSAISQTASARIYEPDPVKRNDPLQELYMCNQPMTFFEEPTQFASLEKGDVVQLDGWVGSVTKVSRYVTISVDLRNGSSQVAYINQMDLLLVIVKARLTTISILENSVCHFGRNGVDGIFKGATFDLPYQDLVVEDGSSSFKWGGILNQQKPADKTTVVRVSVTAVKLCTLSVKWLERINQDSNKAKPLANIRSFSKMKVVSHAKPLKVGDIRLCKMTLETWKSVFGIHAWRSCLAKEYYLHKKRSKRPRLDEGSKEILPTMLLSQVFVEIMTTASKVDVLWTDGTSSQALDSRQLDPVRYTKHFPGEIIFAPPAGVAEEYRPFKGLGPMLTRAVTYQVVESSFIKEINFKDRDRWTVRNYILNPGALEPIVQETREVSSCKTVPQLAFWDHNEPQVVVKRRNSTADFTCGCVIGMFPDGHVRVRKDEDGSIISLWPSDLVVTNHNQVNIFRNIFEGLRDLI